MSTLESIRKIIEEVNKSEEHKKCVTDTQHHLAMFYKEGREEEFKKYQEKFTKSE